MNAIEVEGLTVHYEKRSILWDLSFSLPLGTICGVAGPNGAGKSTLLKAAVGLVKPQAGRISFMDQPIEKMRKRIAYIPQRESIDWDFPITASDVVLMGRYNRFGILSRPRKADQDAAACALEQLGMSAFADRQISHLSGGQQQRLFIARALVQQPDIFLMDEPFNGVDLATEISIVELLQRLKSDGKTVLIVSHDLLNAEKYFDHLLLMNRRLIACGPINQIFNADNLAQTFGKRQCLLDDAIALSAKTRFGM